MNYTEDILSEVTREASFHPEEVRSQLVHYLKMNARKKAREAQLRIWNAQQLGRIARI